MTLTEAIVEAAALCWFEELAHFVLPGPKLAPREPAAERDSLCDVVLEGRLYEAICQINPASSNASQTTVAQPSTVQSICWMNL
jgi:type I restriction enzyme R subunit